VQHFFTMFVVGTFALAINGCEGAKDTTCVSTAGKEMRVRNDIHVVVVVVVVVLVE
jgi:hypothetical protein